MSITAEEQKVLQLISDRLRPIFDVRDIVLFGSRARGTARQDSDYDVLVIVRSDVEFFKRNQVALRAVGLRSFSLDLLVYTESEYNAAQAMTGSALYWAAQEGVSFGA